MAALVEQANALADNINQALLDMVAAGQARGLGAGIFDHPTIRPLLQQYARILLDKRGARWAIPNSGRLKTLLLNKKGYANKNTEFISAGSLRKLVPEVGHLRELRESILAEQKKANAERKATKKAEKVKKHAEKVTKLSKKGEKLGFKPLKLDEVKKFAAYVMNYMKDRAGQKALKFFYNTLFRDIARGKRIGFDDVLGGTMNVLGASISPEAMSTIAAAFMTGSQIASFAVVKKVSNVIEKETGFSVNPILIAAGAWYTGIMATQRYHPNHFVKGGSKRGNYMGPGTDVLGNIRNGKKPVSPSDAVALEHDLLYTLATNQGSLDKADAIFFKRMDDLNKKIGKDPNVFRSNVWMGYYGLSANKLFGTYIPDVSGASLSAEDRKLANDTLRWIRGKSTDTLLKDYNTDRIFPKEEQTPDEQTEEEPFEEPEPPSTESRTVQEEIKKQEALAMANRMKVGYKQTQDPLKDNINKWKPEMIPVDADKLDILLTPEYDKAEEKQFDLFRLVPQNKEDFGLSGVQDKEVAQGENPLVEGNINQYNNTATDEVEIDLQPTGTKDIEKVNLLDETEKPKRIFVGHSSLEKHLLRQPFVMEGYQPSTPLFKLINEPLVSILIN